MRREDFKARVYYDIAWALLHPDRIEDKEQYLADCLEFIELQMPPTKV